MVIIFFTVLFALYVWDGQPINIFISLYHNLKSFSCTHTQFDTHSWLVTFVIYAILI